MESPADLGEKVGETPNNGEYETGCAVRDLGRYIDTELDVDMGKKEKGRTRKKNAAKKRARHLSETGGEDPTFFFGTPKENLHEK